ncbi:unnamed protein product [Parajaminaea phylloscopi]
MSRAAKSTLIGSIVASGLTVWAVHYMQIQERATMYKGVERDEARQAAKRAAREADLQANREREAEFQKVQPTPKFVAHSALEQAEKGAKSLKQRANDLLDRGVGLGDREDRAYITGRWGVNGLQIGAVAAMPLYLLLSIKNGSFAMKRLVRANWTYPLAGGLVGAGSGLVYSQTLNAPSAAKESARYRLDSSVVRRDDVYLIGGVIGALLTPAIFRGAGLFNGLLGGGLGLGGATGMISDRVRGFSSGNMDTGAVGNQAKALWDKAESKAEGARKEALDTLGKAAK